MISNFFFVRSSASPPICPAEGRYRGERFRPRIAGLLLCLLFFACSSDNEPFSNTIPDQVDFNFHIKPILSDRCFACHGPDEQAREADLNLSDSSAVFAALGDGGQRYAIVPGIPDSSVIMQRMLNPDPQERMPPQASNLTMSDQEIALVRKWIEQGAMWKRHWSLIPPKKISPPNVQRKQWPKGPIDQFVLTRLEREGLAPSPQADKATLLRRATFDLTGLPPTFEDLEAFLNDPSETAFAKVIERLLDSPHYGERMASIWLDAARYADTHGYQNDVPRSMWPWRNWVIHAFNKNLPFDTFIRWQLAGDLLPNPTTEQLVATGFNRNHKITFEGGSIDEEFRAEYVADRTHTTATVFMGLTMECARCHDHKYDTISQREYYQLYGFFNQVSEPGVPNYGNMSPQPRLALGWVDAVEELPFIEEVANLKSFQMMVMRDSIGLRKTYVLNRGQYDQPLDEVVPQTLKMLPPLPESAPRNRLGLADWLVSDEHPLTARVQVNRLWHLLFGRGIVATLDDFGSQGALPTHPELLDWLAVDFQENGWNTKGLLKQIMLSSTYQQSSLASPDLLTKDPENELLARGPRYRLPAEMIRDNALSISNLLVAKIGGPSVKPYQPAGLWKEKTAGNGYAVYRPDVGDGLYRRSLYTFWKRTVPPPSMLIFDMGTRDLCAVDRPQTSTPLQALVLLNDPQILEASRFLALRMMAEGGTMLREQIQFGFRLATSRHADDAELAILENLYNEKLTTFRAAPKKAKDFLAVGEKPFAASNLTAEVAAMSVVANLLFNLHETVTKS